MKVTYLTSDDTMSVAYLDESPLSDGSFVGENKHTDLPVHLRWEDKPKMWVEVCQRNFTYEPPLYDTFVEVGERPDCICARETPGWQHGAVDGSGGGSL